jgi:hypothetical protein
VDELTAVLLVLFLVLVVKDLLTASGFRPLRARGSWDILVDGRGIHIRRWIGAREDGSGVRVVAWRSRAVVRWPWRRWRR